jgi:fructan beta-fructosidase
MKRCSAVWLVMLNGQSNIFGARQMKKTDRRSFLKRTALVGMTAIGANYDVQTLVAKSGGPHRLMSEKLRKELYRPCFHFTADHGFMNDPNGLVFYKGEYHLFFQHTEDVRRPMSETQWGHAISRDMVCWTQLPTVIKAKDGYSAFSGSSVLDVNNTAGFKHGTDTPIVAVYTRWGRGQFLAYSTDRGRSFTDYPGNPVITHPNDSKRSFPDSPRDPMVVWYKKGGYWVLLMYQNVEGSRGFGIYKSSDLKQWKFASHVPGFYVCPDLFQLPLDGNVDNLRWVIMDWERYALGDFNGKTFTLQTEMRKIDEASGGGTMTVGLGASANQTWKTGSPGKQDHRIIQIAWLRRGEYPDMPFSQQMTFPTQLSLRTFPEGIRLCRKPIPEIASLYGKSHRVASIELTQDGPNPMADINAECLDLDARFRLGEKTTATGIVSLNIRGVKITYEVKTNSISCLGRSAKIVPVDQKLGLRILVDRTSLELYVDDGRVIFTFYHFFDPTQKDLGLSVVDGTIRIVSLDVHEVRPAKI